ncbi:MAG: class I SAM-dependent methyltransferase [Candidatus Altiarchaeota archaeon]
MVTKETRLVILELLEGEKKGVVLEAGAGFYGDFIEMLLKRGFQVKACDINEKILEMGHRVGIECKVSDLNKRLDYDDSTMDYVILSEVLEHLENPWNAVRECSRVLRKGGVLLISTPNVLHIAYRLLYFVMGEFPHFRLNDYHTLHHITPIPLWNIKRMLSEAGMIPEVITYDTGYMPKLRLHFPIKNIFLGHTLIIKARKPH